MNNIKKEKRVRLINFICICAIECIMHNVRTCIGEMSTLSNTIIDFNIMQRLSSMLFLSVYVSVSVLGSVSTPLVCYLFIYFGVNDGILIILILNAITEFGDNQGLC